VNSERQQAGRSDWFTTASGRTIYLTDPRPGDFAIEDIAHGLSRVCRFGGHVTCGFYSVAQHSVFVSRLVEEALSGKPDLARDVAKRGLLHDAAEAYLGDVISPLKKLLGGYDVIEARFLEAIFVRFQVKHHQHADRFVKIADRIALTTERRDFQPAPTSPWAEDEHGYAPHPDPIEPLYPEQARTLFLIRWQQLN